MLLLITGASGAGKSTVRRLLADDLEPDVVCVELRDVASIPPIPTLAWRQQAAEAAVGKAIELHAEGRHLLLSGDPVAAGEVVAAPSADRLDGVAVLLLDLERDAQAARLSERGDDPSQLPHHVAFAEWMRAHAADPTDRLEVLTTNGWDQMRWHRCRELRDRAEWATTTLDTTRLPAASVTAEVLRWARRVLNGEIRTMRIPA